MRKIFLENLPCIGKKINWKNSVGYKVKFVFDEVEDCFEIIDYKKKEKGSKADICILYKNNKIWIPANGLKNNQEYQLKINILKIINYKYFVGEIFKNKNLDCIIVNTYYDEIRKIKRYDIKCNKCNNIYYGITESNLIRKNNCSFCDNIAKKYISEINSIPTTDSWMIPYFQGGYEEAKQYSYCSNKKIIAKCPDCGRIKTKPISINTIHKTHSIGCICGDGISYPQKYMYMVLEQLQVPFEMEFSPDWINGRRYDFKILTEDIIIETDGGLGHGHKTNLYKNYQESLKIDEYKDMMALKNGIEVIRIDCLYSECDYIKNSIINSKLNQLYNLSIVDFEKCHLFACSNMIKTVCQYYENNRNKTREEIASTFHISKCTVGRYLKKGIKMGFPKYIPSFYVKVRCLNTGYIFNTMTDAAKWCNLRSASSISNCCLMKKNYKTAGKHPITGERLKWERVI